MTASFLESNAFAVTGDRTAEFSPGVRIFADCGADGARYGTVAAALYVADADRTTVTLTLDADGLTANLAAVLHGNDIPASLANHGHTGTADGGVVAHGALSGVGANSHAVIDAFLASKAAASGLASLDAASRVVQDQANATATPGGTKIVMSDASGTVDAWVSDAATGGKGKVQLATVAETQAGACVDKAVTPAGLAGSAKGLIAADTTLHVATTGSDSTGDGSSNAPFASISRALASIRNKLIASGVTVTIQVADGTYLVSSTITIDHPDADKIQILGNTSTEMTVPIASIDTTAKTITVAGDRTGVLQDGDIFGLTGSSTSGLKGGYLASGVAFDGTNTVITCAAETIASATVGGGSIVIKPCNRCVLSGASGLVMIDILKGLKLLAGIRIDQSGTATAVKARSQGKTFVGSLIVYGGQNGIFAQEAASVGVQGGVIKGTQYGLYAYIGGIISVNVLTIVDNCTTIGVRAASWSNILAVTAYMITRGNGTDYSPALNTVGNSNSYISSSF
ncbi:hypothetical protein [Solidesulfovibrio alcoholivorans]|uniref:hypothetical protein n=1 Tax=Solidesulfovibrio alcoholivorans TaxID=81406 RepID=UPI0005C1724C|nr:hypothetical protein [Solidesulfovibrio alcoholivorans]